MLKRFALIAAVSALLVGCGGENTEAMEQEAKEAEATANELLDQVSAEAEAASQAAGAVVDSAAAATDAAVEGAEEAAH
jgi:PBP1b-binding outer membrane lipoprotein LpoB